MEKEAALVQRMHQEGHLIGNHSWSHSPWIGFFLKKRLLIEMQSTQDLLHKLLGVHMRWYRPPFGVTNPHIMGMARELQLHIIGWSVRSFDTMTENADKLIHRCSHVQPGDIVLLHDRCTVTRKALGPIIETIRQQGLQIVRLDQLIEKEAYFYE
jgi:peptidoglycan/xylan/chitin deacetylase (PgdA/CDA1 family)